MSAALRGFNNSDLCAANPTTFSAWQSFTAGASGLLTAVSVDCGGNCGDTTVTIHAGSGTGGPVLYTTTMTTLPGMQKYVLAGMPPVTSGSIYTLFLQRPSVTGGTFFRGTTGNAYPAGNANVGAGDFNLRFQTFVGVTTCAAEATLDIRGYARLAVNLAAPASCTTANAGSIALTSTFRICACNGTSWVHTHDLTACTW